MVVYNASFIYRIIMIKALIYIACIMSIICSYSCEQTHEEDYPWAEHTYYIGIGSVGGVSGNGLEYSVNKEDLLEIPVYFKSSYSRPYSPKVYYFLSSVSGDNDSLVCGEDYVLLDTEGQILAPEQNGGYSIIWKNAENGVHNIYIKILSDKKGTVKITILNPDNDVADPNIIVKTEKYEVRAYPNNNYVTVNANIKTEEPVLPNGYENILVIWDFEGDNPLHNLHIYSENDINEQKNVVKDPDNPDNNVMYIELEPGKDRNEVKWLETETYNYYFYANNNDINHGDEFWIGLKVYIPRLEKYQQNNSPSVFQIGPISRSENFDGSYGFYQLMAPTHYAYWKWRKYYYEDYTPWAGPDGITEYPTKLEYNKWERVVIHCILRDNDEGLIEIWKDDKKVYTCQQANAKVGTRVVIQFGVYIGVGNSSKDVLSCYYDDIKIGNALSGYDAVAPK